MTFYGLLAAIGEAESVTEVEKIAKKARAELNHDDYTSLAEAALMRMNAIRLSEEANPAQNES